MSGKTGRAELVLKKSEHQLEELIGGVHQATGFDANGAWSMGITGVSSRLREDESAAIRFDGWMARREWQAAFSPGRDPVTCPDPAGSRVRMRYQLPTIGDPELEFDLETKALISASASASDGKRTTTMFDAWSPADAKGVRWPEITTTVDSSGNKTTYRWVANEPGLACKGVGAGSERRDCAPPRPKLTFDWPASDVVKIPMKLYLGELSLRVRVDGRETWALLDSGAGITVVDSTTPTGKTFVSTLQVDGSGSSQKVSAGMGELKRVELGGLRLEHLPAASIPIPALDGFGNRRPELILGFSLFEAAAIRIDYAKNEIVLSPTADALVKPDLPSVPLRLLEGKPIAETSVDGAVGPFLVDTGNAGGVDMIKRWADAHGFPGGRSTVELKARTGAGEAETVGTIFRAAKAALGPITHDDRLVQIDDPPEPGILAGLVGNEVLSRCTAIVFDVRQRTLWFEPPCDRPSPEGKSGWRLTKKEAQAFADRPWIIEKIVPGGSAELAGFEVGDRILMVGTVVAGPDVSKVQELLQQADGTKLRVTFDRKGERKQSVMVLKRVLAP